MKHFNYQHNKISLSIFGRFQLLKIRPETFTNFCKAGSRQGSRNCICYFNIIFVSDFYSCFDFVCKL